MSNTLSVASVTAADAHPREDANLLTEQMNSVRRIHLKHRAPRSPRIHQLRRDLAPDKVSGLPRKEAMLRILEIAYSDIDDGAPPAAVCEWAKTFMNLVEIRAQERAAAKGQPVIGPDPLALIQAENRAQAEKDDAEREVLAHPTSPVALKRLLDADACYVSKNERMVRGIRWTYARAISQRAVSL
jgi:hypothetical protein